MGLIGIFRLHYAILNRANVSRYHAHDKATMQDGLYGAIQVRSVYQS